MNIAIGSDHGGYKLKQALAVYLTKSKHKVFDVGTFTDESCDYPDFAKKVTQLILNKKAKIGILVCGTGLGMSMAANRYKGIRAALCHNIKITRLSREHNNANVLVFGKKYVKENLAKKMCNVFMKTEFLGGRHLRRIRKIEK